MRDETPADARPKVVLFDLDDTLFNHRGASDAGIGSYLVSLGTPFATADAATAAAFWTELEERHYHSYLAGTLDYEGQRRARAHDFAAAHGVELDADASISWYARYFEHYVDNWILHEDALPCLDRIEREIPGVRFGIVTNGDRAFQLRKIERVGLDRRVEHVVASGELEITKPDPRIFAEACARFGVRPGEAAYVGDRLRTDAIAAAAAGLTGIWLNRTGREMTPAEAADAGDVIEIRTLADLPAALR